MATAPTCLICFSKTHPLVSTPCNHNEICAVCYVRIRALDETMECPICKTSNEQVVVGEKRIPQPFEEYHIWGDQLGDGYEYHESSGMFFPKEYYSSTIQPLFEFRCRTCEEDKLFPSYRALQEHLRVEHRLTLCTLCVDNKRDFVARLPRYAPSGLQKHMNHPNHGHAKCKFCKPMLYDVLGLYKHLREEHYQCHICNAYFKNYDQLHRHFDSYHFSCKHPSCIQARFVAFGTELDLIHHQREFHGDTATPTISLSFKTSRRSASDDNDENDSGLDPNGFLPPSMRQRQESVGEDVGNLHPQHVQRTEELRQQAAILREQQADVPEPMVFPSLGETVNTRDRLSVGWSDRPPMRTRAAVGSVTEEAFPALPASAPKRRSIVVQPQRQQANQRNAGNWGHQLKQGVQRNTNNWKSSLPAARATPTPLVGSSAPQMQNPFPTQGENFPALQSGGWASSTKEPVQHGGKAPTMSKDNFPSLAAGTKKKTSTRYSAAENFAKKLQQAPAVHQNNFLKPPPGFSKPSVAAPAAKTLKAPDTKSGAQFPSLATAAPNDPGSLANIKTDLGLEKYKALKSLTKEYSTGVLAPEAYVDRAFALLEGADSFFRFVPALVASCPTVNPMMAQDYIRELRVQSNGGAPDTSVYKKKREKGKQARELRALAFGS